MNRNQKNIITASALALFAVGMLAFGPELSRFYNYLCCKTGLNGKQACEQDKPAGFDVADKERWINVEFMATLNNNMPMVFRAETPQIKVHPGEYYTVNYYAENKTDHEIVTTAVPSYAPGLAINYFRKIQCFCFTEQKFKPHESKLMPVKFIVSADLPEEYNTMTLSYTFFDNTNKTVRRGSL